MGPSDTDVSPTDVIVDVDFSTSSVPAFEGDMILKIFHNVDNPNTLKCPVQVWFHPSFENDGMHLSRPGVDGPHKDTKHKKFSKDFGIVMRFETVA